MEDFFEKLKFDTTLAPQTGKILISEPFAPDDTFKRAVVLLVRHKEEEGTVGLILNKPTGIHIKDAIATFPEFKSEVFYGGPVSPNNLYFLHTHGDAIQGSMPVVDGLYWGGDFEQIKMMVTTGEILPNSIRFFAGYSGWSEGQLENEMAEKAWIVADINQQEVMRGAFDKQWSRSLRKMGKQFAVMANFPSDPSLN